jgi:hypothetical protein
MRTSKGSDDYLLIVAKKKPRLQALVDSLPQLTQGDIDALTEPLWIRQALTRLKEADGKGQAERVQEIVDAAIARENAAALLPKPTYEVRLWSDAPKFIGDMNPQGNTWTIEIMTNDVCLLLDDHTVKVGDSVIKIMDMQSVIRGSKLVGYMNLVQYKGFCQALLNQRHPTI